ncbi:diacylglycerol kinase family lipid kinase [bacterium]|nr:diacylglycerol kinase family lipid kinase [bacterium]
MFKKISVIVNPIAGGKRNSGSTVNRVTEYFFSNGYEKEIRLTNKPGDANIFAKDAIHDRKDLVMVIGGDGTINEVASGLVGCEVPMAIVPVGSGNGLARSLNIPTRIEEACQLITEGRMTAIDVGKVNDRYFFSVLGVGFDAAVGRSFNSFHTRGPMAYVYLGIREYLRFRPDRIKINFGNKSLDIAPFLICVANGQQYGNNALIAPEAKLNDGLLDVCIVHRLTIPDLFSAVPKLFQGKLQRYSQAEFHRAKEVVIEREADQHVNLDGETVLQDARIKISILPKSLKVFTPKKTAALV